MASIRPSSAGSGVARQDEGFWVGVLPFKYGGSDEDLEAIRLEVGAETRIDLWYAEDDSWQALQTEVANGRKLKYLRREG